jgi:hypothetical protein
MTSDPMDWFQNRILSHLHSPETGPAFIQVHESEALPQC